MFYLINKSKGCSSFAVINSFAKENKIKKIGHTGTLDPLASGLLLVATDEDTKLIPYIKHNNKAYITTIQFGKQTDTYDSEGTVINHSEVKVGQSDVQKITSWLNSQSEQIPPSYSAKKVNGAKSYELARKGKSIELKPQSIKVFDSKVLSFNSELQQAVVYMNVSKGAYIRSLVNDLGIFLNTYAYMSELDRVKVGELDIDLLKGKSFIDVSNYALFSLPFYEPTYAEIRHLKNGISILNNKRIKNGEYILKTNQINWGIVSVDSDLIKVKRIFGNRIKEVEQGEAND